MRPNAGADFAVFYDEWFAKVYNYARHRTGSASRADEIVSDVFERVWKSWAKFDPGKATIQTWLFSIAFRCVADHYRSEKRLGFAELPETQEKSAGPAEQLEGAQELKNLLAALNELSQEQREIVTLRFFGGMTNRAIAELMGMTEQNVAVILFRSVRRMRTNFPGAEAKS